MTDKLPEWPEPLENCSPPSEELRHYRQLSVCWESRCRLAVEALNEITRDRKDSLRNYYLACGAVKEIGPLPPVLP